MLRPQPNETVEKLPQGTHFRFFWLIVCQAQKSWYLGVYFL
jgi:hypothetical protein